MSSPVSGELAPVAASWLRSPERPSPASWPTSGDIPPVKRRGDAGQPRQPRARTDRAGEGRSRRHAAGAAARARQQHARPRADFHAAPVRLKTPPPRAGIAPPPARSNKTPIPARRDAGGGVRRRRGGLLRARGRSLQARGHRDVRRSRSAGGSGDAVRSRGAAGSSRPRIDGACENITQRRSRAGGVTCPAMRTHRGVGLSVLIAIPFAALLGVRCSSGSGPSGPVGGPVSGALDIHCADARRRCDGHDGRRYA